MLRRLGIRAKVLAVLAVPMLVVLLAGAFISYETVQNLRSEQTARQIVALVDSYVTVNDALNDERVVSQSDGATPEQIEAARGATDTAFDAFQELWDADSTGLAGFSSGVANQIEAVERGLNEDLPQLRADVDAGQLRVVGRGYASLVDSQLTLINSLAQELPNREVATYLAAYLAVARTSDSLVQERVDGEDLLTAAEPSAAAGQAYTTLASQTEVYRETARTAVSSLAIPGVLLPSGDPSGAFTRMRALIGSGSADAMSVVDLGQFSDDITQQRASFTRVSHDSLAAADAVAANAISAAQQRAAATIGITALAALTSLLLALIVARAIVIPLRRLTAAATDLREELPILVEQVQVPGEGPQMSVPQIPVTSRDEVGRLAAAFNSVNSTTIQVAQEQAALRGSIAEMFVNVARRDQVLLNRQMSFIDSLERTEEDPQTLANLFRLDHLATRMRRNAESLLVLAGIDSGRRLRDSLPLSDVVRTASSEIEQYDRIQLDLQADPHMLGFNALPAAHLLAELLENATVFSEPETPVSVSTGVAGPFVEVRIVDQGLGMSEAELAAANEKIASTSASNALGAQRLGLFVVGRLAHRLGTEVVLRKNSQGATGTETIVRFPAALFQSTEASPLGVYGSAAARAEQPPVVSEVDLGSLTDGVTDRGLPRRRSDAPGLPARVSAYPSDDRIVLPEVTAPATLSPDLASPDWSPVVVSDTASGLPARTPSAGPDTTADAAPARPAADPAARAGMFAGFRGRGDLPTTLPQSEPAPAEPAGPAFVVPGLVPDEDEPEDRAGEAPAWPAWPAAGGGEAEPSWSAGSPVDEIPIAVDEIPVAVAPEVPVADEPPVEAAKAVAAEPVVERWSPPAVDVTQWAAPAQEAPTFEPGADAFAGLNHWSSSAPVADEPAAYAPFERSLDEARAWATGAIPVVPVPAAAAEPQPMVVPGLEPDEPAPDVREQNPWSQDGESSFAIPQLEPEPWALEAEPAVAEPVAQQPVAPQQPLAPQQPEPSPAVADGWSEPATPVWAPVVNGASPAFAEAPPAFGDVVRAEPAPAKRRGWFGRRKHDEVAEQPPAPPVVLPEPAAPVRPSGWAPAAATPEPVAEPFPVRRSALTPPPAPVAPPEPVVVPDAVPAPGGAWAAQSSWKPPAGATPFEAPARPPAAGWSPPEWAPHAAEPTAPEVVAPAPIPEPSVAPRIGTLDDEVAAMLALRSDIQEQALSELSQLSSYRPHVVQASDRLTRRVPTAVPEAPEIVESDNAERDPEELRSRLASFQSGTARGRRDAGHGAETT